MKPEHKSTAIHSLLFQKLLEVGTIQKIEKGAEILREGQFVKLIPFVRKGLIKVFTRYEDRELLLYYIQPEESCIMSFSAGFNNEPSQVYAVAEEDTEVLLLPLRELRSLTNSYPDINRFFFQQYKGRYAELLNTIHHVLFDKIDVRLYQHLKEKSALKKENPLRMSHHCISF